MWTDHGVEFFIHPAMRANPEILSSFGRTAMVSHAA